MGFLASCGCAVLMYYRTAWTLMKCSEKKLDGSYKNVTCCFGKIQETCTPQNSSCMATYLLSCKIIPIRQRYAWLCWRSKDKLRNNILQWTPTHGHTHVGQLANTCIYQVCTDTRYSLEDQLEIIVDRRGC